jgi:hypothetical protein
MRTIRASELGSYLFCRRSWWYQLKGEDSENITELASGNVLHHKHGRTVMFSGVLRTLGYAFILVSLVLMAIYLTDLIL